MSPSSPSSPDAAGTLVVETQSRPGLNGEFYFEGAVEEVLLLDETGERLVAKTVTDGAVQFRSLPADDYLLKAALRPCNGSCEDIGLPTDKCTARIPVEGRVRVKILFRVGSPCLIEFRNA